MPPWTTACSEDILLYASVSSGFKSGVITTLPINPTPPFPRWSKSYELGIKSELFDRKLRLNAAIFQSILLIRKCSVSWQQPMKS